MELSDKRLISLCKNGEREGYDGLYQKYEKYIYKLCYHYTESKEDALDLLQEVYIKLYRSMERVDENLPVIPWIKRITINTCLNFARCRKESTLSLNMVIDDDDNSVEDLIASSSNVEEEAGLVYTRDMLKEMINELPGDIRMAIMLRHMEDMSYDDIAKVMSLPVGTVKTYIFRGRRILKNRLTAAGVWGV